MRLIFRTRTILLAKVKESLDSVLPITAIVFILCFSVISVPTDILMAFVVGAVMLIFGMGLFTLGTDLSMTPVGEHIGFGCYQIAQAVAYRACQLCCRRACYHFRTGLAGACRTGAEHSESGHCVFGCGRRGRVFGGRDAAYRIRIKAVVYAHRLLRRRIRPCFLCTERVFVGCL